MSAADLVLLIVSAAVFVYLGVALFKPDRF